MRSRRVLLAAGALLALAACSGGSDGGATGTGGSTDQSTTQATDVPDGMVLVETDIGVVARPEEWQPAPAEDSVGQDASFLMEDDDGAVVGQMDVVVESASPGTAADAISATIQGTRMPSIPTLRHDRRAFVEVPGAESAFITESHYQTADTGVPAKSIDLVAARGDGRFLLVRISSTEQAYDAAQFQKVLDTVRLTAAAES